MTEYLLKSSVALAAVYLLYFVFARKNTNFRWLRVYFLVAIAVSFAFPALRYLPDFHQQDLVSIPSEYVPAWIEDAQVVTVDVPQTSVVKQKVPLFTLSDIVKYAYCFGVLFLLLKFIIGLSQLLWLVFRNGIRRVGNDHLVLVPNLPAPFSFFHLIFINRQYLSDSGHEVMLQHERAHVRLWHTVDLLLLEFITITHWFNPFAWAMRRTIKELHEFQADDVTVRKHISPLEYQHLLLSQVCGIKIYLPANGFNSSLTKKRIFMITNNKRNRKWFGIFLLLLIVITAIDSLSRITAAQQFVKNSKEEIIKTLASIYAPHIIDNNRDIKIDAQSDTSTNKSIKTALTADTIATSSHSDSMYRGESIKIKMEANGYPRLFNGTKESKESREVRQKFIRENLRYPESLKDKNKEAIVFIRFEIDANGKVQNIVCNNDKMKQFYMDAEMQDNYRPDKFKFVKRTINLISNDSLFIKEAIRVIALQPNYEPEKGSLSKKYIHIETVEVYFGNNDIFE